MASKKNNCLSWEEYFAELVKLVSKRSKDPIYKVGAIIVNPKNKTIVSTGYNGMPRGCGDDEFP
jgi:dCMP deaminase